MKHELNLTNARLVLADRVVEGSLSVRDGKIASVDEGKVARAPASDLEGDWLLPGLVEVHTDNLEGHVKPRPKVVWPMMPALLAHDAELTAAGITTVFDSLRLGDDTDDDRCYTTLKESVAAIHAAEDAQLLRSDHRIHVRLEICKEGVVEDFRDFMDEPLLAMCSLMDHTPGQRQFANLDAYRTYYMGKMGFGEAEMEAYIEARMADHARWAAANRSALSRMVLETGKALASHDDATAEHVAEAAGLGLTISEFPTTVAAARACREHGLWTIGGAPNLVRGKSHSGNVAAAELARQDLLDSLASDYVPASLLLGVFRLHDDLGWDLSRAAAVASLNPARMTGFDDRGEIAEGKRADLIWVTRSQGLPVVRGVWRGGRRVM
jgi:alpha-D-ribose 1-methylphosphonate 5-triphosphate diphosphatase